MRSLEVSSLLLAAALAAAGTYTIGQDGFTGRLGGSEVFMIYDLAGATLAISSSSSTRVMGTIVGTGRFIGRDNPGR